MQTTVFRNGGSQAIRIPAQFRFDTETVDVEWDDRLGALVVRPSVSHRIDAFFRYMETQPRHEGPLPYPVDRDGRFDVTAFFDTVENV